MTRLLALGLGVVAVAGLLTGCAEVPTAAPASSRAIPSAAATPSADPLQARFDAVAHEIIAADPRPSGRAFAAALVGAGFPRDSVEATADRTAVGRPVPSVQFAVRAGIRCVIGQFGPDAAYRSATADAVDGRCLIGDGVRTG